MGCDCSGGCSLCVQSTFYSDRCVDALDDLCLCLYGKDMPLLFYWGVFCTDETYATFPWDEADVDAGIVPCELGSGVSLCNRMSYVRMVISQVMRGCIVKPEWMWRVEEGELCEGMMPSTFLRLEVREDSGLPSCAAQSLLDFLYSVRTVPRIIGEGC